MLTLLSFCFSAFNLNFHCTGNKNGIVDVVFHLNFNTSELGEVTKSMILRFRKKCIVKGMLCFPFMFLK